MGVMASKITSLTIVYSTVYSGLCAGNSPVTGEFPAQMASNAENVSIWWRRRDITVAEKVVTQVARTSAHLV